MKNLVVANVLVGIVCLMVAGCDSSESAPIEKYPFAGKDVQREGKEIGETIQALLDKALIEYVQVIVGKFGQLRDKHEKLVAQVQQGRLESDINATVDNLAKKRGEVQTQIEALITAKGTDWLELQLGMNVALEELAQSYDTALAQFSG